MTKLERYLTKNSNAISKAENTLSTYYSINSITVRVSDHFPSENTEKCDLYIISPSESKTTNYVVQLPESRKCSIWTADKIINFISFLQIYRRLISVDRRDKVVEVDGITFSPKIKSSFKAEQLNKNLRRALTHNSTKTWTLDEQFWLRELLSKEFKFSIIFTSDFETFLHSQALGYNEVLNLYNLIILNGGDFSKDNINKIYEQSKEYY